MGKVDDKRVHNGRMTLTIGGLSGSLAEMVSLLELIDIGERFGNELAQRIASRDHPLPNPSVTGGCGPPRFLGAADRNLRDDRQRTTPIAMAERTHGRRAP